MSAIVRTGVTGSVSVRADFEWRAALAVYVLSAMLGFTAALTIQLQNLSLHAAGLPSGWIGASTAMQAAGIVVGALVSIPLLRLAGSAAVACGGIVLAGSSLLLMALGGDWAATTGLRLLMAIGNGVALTTAEYVLVARAPLNRRATMLALYGTSGLAGQCMAPLLISVAGTASLNMLAIAGAGMLAISFLPFAARMRRRVEPSEGKLNLAMLIAAPAAFLPAFAFGMMDGGMIDLLNLYFVHADFNIATASLFAGTAVAGALLMQLPVAWLSDRLGTDRILPLVWMAIAAAVFAIWVAKSPWLILAAAFTLGGACDALYSVGFAALSTKLPAVRLASANCGFVALCGTGEIVGPIVGGGSLGVGGGTGFAAAFLTIALAGLYFALSQRRVKSAP